MSHSNRILSIVSAFFLMAVAAVAQDLVKVAPKNVKVLLDNSQVRVLEYTAKKGVKIGLHSHPPYVVYALEPGTTHFTLPDGKTKDLVLKKGEAIWSDGGAHTQESLTDNHVIVIELKTAKPIGPPVETPKKK
jgi:quercetin dioxygenase-like cupin family protein